MGGGFFDIIILALLAAFIIFRLRSVLGKRTGHERPQPDPFGRSTEPDSKSDNVVPLPDREATDGRPDPSEPVAPQTPLEAGVFAIRSVDETFDPTEFVNGAKSAFEMIVTSFALGDLSNVKAFLGKDVYDRFSDAVEERLKAKETLETTVVGFTNAELVEASLAGRMATVTVNFVSEQINATRDRNGDVIDGDPEQPVAVTDVWTFSRDTRSRDPNWTLVETGSVQ